MSRRLPPALSLGLALLAGAAGGCGDRAAPAPEAAAPPNTRPILAHDSAAWARDTTSPPTPFDAAEVVFDTVEPPERIVRIPERPAPRPPAPDPPDLPPPPPHNGPSGSCDVRAGESFCFAYTGSGWTQQSAEDHCAGAPNAVYGRGSCPLTGRIGTCTFARASDPAREIVYTYYEPYDVALAELACPGTFTRVR